MMKWQYGLTCLVSLLGSRWIGLPTLLIAAVVFMGWSTGPTAAQTDFSISTEVPACVTNLGSEGRLINGVPGMVFAPGHFDDVTITGTALEIFPTLRNELGVLIREEAFAKAGSAQLEKAMVEFSRKDGMVVHRCNVEEVAYEPDFQDIERLQVGNCSFKLVAGMPTLIQGHLQVWEASVDAADFDVGPRAVMDVSSLSETMFMLVGKSPGISVVVWSENGEGDMSKTNLCPFRTLSTSEMRGTDSLADASLCRDTDGNPMRLSVGQNVTMRMPESDGRGFTIDEYALGDPKIARGTWSTAQVRLPVITGISPGTTSIIMLGYSSGVQARSCVVRVE